MDDENYFILNASELIVLGSDDQASVSGFVITPTLGRREHCQTFSPHSNLALFRHCGPVEHLNGGECHSCAVHSKCLDQLMDECHKEEFCLSDDFRKRILLQVTHGLDHMHAYNMFHGHIAPENVMLPDHETYNTSRANAVIADFQMDDTEMNHTQRTDILQLADLYEYVLKNGFDGEEELICRDHMVAKNLIQKMKTDVTIATKDILRDPFFWSDEKKVNFLLRSFDYLKSNKRLDTLDTEDLRDWARKDKFGNSILDLTDSEFERCQKHLRHDDEDCSKTAIRQRALKKHKDDKRKKISELLRFFRNGKEHFYDFKGPIMWSYEENETKYWNYFSRRFPTLFCHVHETMRKNKFLERPGLKEIYMDAICENAPLPNPETEPHNIPIYEYEMEYLPIENSLYFPRD